MPSGGQNKIDRDDLQSSIETLAADLGESPTLAQYREDGEYSAKAIYNEFGSWNAALEACDLQINEEFSNSVEVDCANCGETIQKTPSEIENNQYNYCSQDCHYEHKRERYSGDGNPQSTLAAVECDNCGEELQRPKWKREANDYHFCDYDCAGKWRGENRSGKDSPNWKDFPTLTCEYCGKAYKARPSEADKRVTCSNDCWYQWYSERMVGEDNPVYNSVEKDCENCGDSYTVKQSEADNSRYCCFECMHEDAHPTGEDHPRHNPDSERIYYGPNWQEQRLKALIRDQARCSNPECRMTEQEHLHKYGKGLDMHHKTRLEGFRSDNGIDYEQANAIGNLASYCRSCHNKADSDSYSLPT